jgi:hypothetical protein
VIPARTTPARQKVLDAAAAGPMSGAELAERAGVSSGVVKGLLDEGVLARELIVPETHFDDLDWASPGPDLNASQRAAADVLVAHLHDEVATGLRQHLEQVGGHRDAAAGAAAESGSIPALLDAAGEFPGLCVDVSHLQSVLRVARISVAEPTIRRAWELATYASRLPADVVYAGEPPFENVGEASRLFFGCQLGHDVDRAVRFFRAAAATADPGSGTLPADTLVLLLARIGRPAEALHAALARPRDDGMPSPLQAAGALPGLVELAAASGEWELLRRACRERGDEITFAATLVAERQKTQGNLGPQA